MPLTSTSMSQSFGTWLRFCMFLLFSLFLAVQAANSSLLRHNLPPIPQYCFNERIKFEINGFGMDVCENYRFLENLERRMLENDLQIKEQMEAEANISATIYRLRRETRLIMSTKDQFDRQMDIIIWLTVLFFGVLLLSQKRDGKRAFFFRFLLLFLISLFSPILSFVCLLLFLSVYNFSMSNLQSVLRLLLVSLFSFSLLKISFEY
jgi:hypothetical protein